LSKLKNFKTRLKRRKNVKRNIKRKPKKQFLMKRLKMRDPAEAAEAEVVVAEVVEETTEVATRMIVLARWVAVQDQPKRPTFIEPVQSSKVKTTALSTLLHPVPNLKRQNKSRPT
jgi:hypothetical protein